MLPATNEIAISSLPPDQVFSDETLKLHDHLLASELAQMFLQQDHKGHQVGAAIGSQESVPPPSPRSQESVPPPFPEMSPVVFLILNHWRE